MAKVAFLGLGVMGYPMAGHLKNKGGHDVTVYNRTAAKAEQWVKEYDGGKVARTPEEAAVLAMLRTRLKLVPDQAAPAGLANARVPGWKPAAAGTATD